MTRLSVFLFAKPSQKIEKSQTKQLLLQKRLVNYRFSIFISYFLHFISPINKKFKLWSKTIRSEIDGYMWKICYTRTTEFNLQTSICALSCNITRNAWYSNYEVLVHWTDSWLWTAPNCSSNSTLKRYIKGALRVNKQQRLINKLENNGEEERDSQCCVNTHFKENVKGSTASLHSN